MMWINMVQPDRTRMLFACWISKAARTHAQNMYYLLIFHGKNGYAKATRCPCIITLPALLTLKFEDLLTYSMEQSPS